MIWSNWACYTKINTIPLFNVFSQQIFIPLVKNSGEVAQIFCLIMLEGEILLALNLVQCVGNICTVRLELRMRQGTRSQNDKDLYIFLYPWHCQLPPVVVPQQTLQSLGMVLPQGHIILCLELSQPMQVEPEQARRSWTGTRFLLPENSKNSVRT